MPGSVPFFNSRFWYGFSCAKQVQLTQFAAFTALEKPSECRMKIVRPTRLWYCSSDNEPAIINATVQQKPSGEKTSLGQIRSTNPHRGAAWTL